MNLAPVRRCGLAAALLTALVAPLAAAHSAPAAPTPAGSTFTQLAPARVLDTRLGIGAPATPVGPGGTITLDVSARMPSTATAVVLNVTGTEPTAGTFVTVYPHGAPRPLASSLNLVPGQTAPNQVTVQVGPDRHIDLYNNAGSTHLVADIGGYYSTDPGSKFTMLQPNRVLDTRTTGQGPVGPGGVVTFDLNGKVPASATAVTFNLTGTEPTAATFVTAWPASFQRPLASSLNLVAAETRPNLVTVALDADRRVSLFNNAGSVHLIVDLAGFYTRDYGALFFPNTPARVLDTRTGAGTPIPPGAEFRSGIGPTFFHDGTAAAVLNLTGVEPNGPTVVTAWPWRTFRPLASNLNLTTGQIAPNAAVVGLGGLAEYNLYSSAAPVHLVADLAGVFAYDTTPCQSNCVVAWGDNSQGQLGTGQIHAASANPTAVISLSGATAVAGQFSNNGYALKSDGTVVAWGDNHSGQLGNGWSSPSETSIAEPVPVVGLSDVIAIAPQLALKSDGTVWAWGSGIIAVPDSTVPVQIPGPTGIRAIAAGVLNGYALTSDGQVWAWGRNFEGQLGTGVTGDERGPALVPGLTGVTAIVSGEFSVYAITSDGNVWTWGDNRSGQLGIGLTCDQTTGVGCRVPSPVQITSLSNVRKIAGDVFRAFAVKADGTAWAFGDNRNGGLGIGVECDQRTGVGCTFVSPTQINGIAGVADVAGYEFGAYALLSDHTVWGWGSNFGGELANGSVFQTNVPVRVGDLTGVTAIAGGVHTGRALMPTPGR